MTEKRKALGEREQCKSAFHPRARPSEKTHARRAVPDLFADGTAPRFPDLDMDARGPIGLIRICRAADDTDVSAAADSADRVRH